MPTINDIMNFVIAGIFFMFAGLPAEDGSKWKKILYLIGGISVFAGWVINNILIFGPRFGWI